jgi:small subunit ribosomal protein S20
MANIKSQIKRNKQNEAARVRNKGTRSALKTKIKKFTETASAGNAEASAESYKDAAKALDKAASKGAIHKNTAARKKSRLAKRLSG